jgi:hypothetical protein
VGEKREGKNVGRKAGRKPTVRPSVPSDPSAVLGTGERGLKANNQPLTPVYYSTYIISMPIYIASM